MIVGCWVLIACLVIEKWMGERHRLGHRPAVIIEFCLILRSGGLIQVAWLHRTPADGAGQRSPRAQFTINSRSISGPAAVTRQTRVPRRPYRVLPSGEPQLSSF